MPFDSDTSGLLDALPSFVKLISPRSTEPLEAFDCWATEPTGDDLADYASGADNLDAAIRFATSFGALNFLSYVVAAISRRRSLGPMERGFLDALGARAAVAPQVKLDDEAQSDPDLMAGADLANTCLEKHDARLVQNEIYARLREPGITVGGMLHTFCRAALLGSRN